MKKIASILICIWLMLCAPAVAEETDFSAFSGEVTWATTIDEAMAALGESVQRTDDYDETVGSATLLTAQGLIQLGAECDCAMIYFNDELFAVYFYFGDLTDAEIDALVGNVSASFGEAQPQENYTLSDYISELSGGNVQDTLYRWKGIAGTDAYFTRVIAVDGSISHHLCFENISVGADISAAFGMDAD